MGPYGRDPSISPCMGMSLGQLSQDYYGVHWTGRCAYIETMGITVPKVLWITRKQRGHGTKGESLSVLFTVISVYCHSGHGSTPHRQAWLPNHGTRVRSREHRDQRLGPEAQRASITAWATREV